MINYIDYVESFDELPGDIYHLKRICLLLWQ